MELNAAPQHTSLPQSIWEVARTAMLIIHSKTVGRLVHKGPTMLLGGGVSVLWERVIYFFYFSNAKIFWNIPGGGRWGEDGLIFIIIIINYFGSS